MIKLRKMLCLKIMMHLFRSCISKANSTLIDNVEDLDIVMTMLEYSPNQELYGVIIETKLMMRIIML